MRGQKAKGEISPRRPAFIEGRTRNSRKKEKEQDLRSEKKRRSREAIACLNRRRDPPGEGTGTEGNVGGGEDLGVRAATTNRLLSDARSDGGGARAALKEGGKAHARRWQQKKGRAGVDIERTYGQPLIRRLRR